MRVLLGVVMNSLLKLRASEWHGCLAREFQTAIQNSASRSVAAEFALRLCRTEEDAIIGSAGLSPSETAQVLTQAKATLKQQMIAGTPAPTGTPEPQPLRQPGI
jgi:hypothetical protein